MERAGAGRSARSIGCVGALAAGLFAAATAHGANYQLVANAHCDGESTTDVEVGSVSGMDRNPDDAAPSYEIYSAAASGSGSLSASADSIGVPPFSVCSNRAVARIEETLKLPTDPFPSGPVTVTVGFVTGALLASFESGSVANASAQVQLEPFSLTCSANESANFGPSGSCPGGTVGDLEVSRTFSLVELGNRQWEIDVAAQVDASLELFGAAGISRAESTGSLWVMVTGGGVASYTWTGANTNIPAPEPLAGSLACAALASLAELRRRRR